MQTPLQDPYPTPKSEKNVSLFFLSKGKVYFFLFWKGGGGKGRLLYYWQPSIFYLIYIYIYSCVRLCGVGGGEKVFGRGWVCVMRIVNTCSSSFTGKTSKSLEINGNWKCLKNVNWELFPLIKSKFLYGRRLMLKGKAFETMYINLGS